MPVQTFAKIDPASLTFKDYALTLKTAMKLITKKQEKAYYVAKFKYADGKEAPLLLFGVVDVRCLVKVKGKLPAKVSVPAVGKLTIEVKNAKIAQKGLEKLLVTAGIPALKITSLEPTEDEGDATPKGVGHTLTDEVGSMPVTKALSGIKNFFGKLVGGAGDEDRLRRLAKVNEALDDVDAVIAQMVDEVGLKTIKAFQEKLEGYRKQVGELDYLPAAEAYKRLDQIKEGARKLAEAAAKALGRFEHQRPEELGEAATRGNAVSRALLGGQEGDYLRRKQKVLEDLAKANEVMDRCKKADPEEEHLAELAVKLKSAQAKIEEASGLEDAQNWKDAYKSLGEAKDALREIPALAQKVIADIKTQRIADGAQKQTTLARKLGSANKADYARRLGKVEEAIEELDQIDWDFVYSKKTPPQRKIIRDRRTDLWSRLAAAKKVAEVEGELEGDVDRAYKLLESVKKEARELREFAVEAEKVSKGLQGVGVNLEGEAEADLKKGAAAEKAAADLKEKAAADPTTENPVLDPSQWKYIQLFEADILPHLELSDAAQKLFALKSLPVSCTITDPESVKFMVAQQDNFLLLQKVADAANYALLAKVISGVFNKTAELRQTAAGKKITDKSVQKMVDDALNRAAARAVAQVAKAGDLNAQAMKYYAKAAIKITMAAGSVALSAATVAGNPFGGSIGIAMGLKKLVTEILNLCKECDGAAKSYTEQAAQLRAVWRKHTAGVAAADVIKTVIPGASALFGPSILGTIEKAELWRDKIGLLEKSSEDMSKGINAALEAEGESRRELVKIARTVTTPAQAKAAQEALKGYKAASQGLQGLLRDTVYLHELFAAMRKDYVKEDQMLTTLRAKQPDWAKIAIVLTEGGKVVLGLGTGSASDLGKTFDIVKGLHKGVNTMVKGYDVGEKASRAFAVTPQA